MIAIAVPDRVRADRYLSRAPLHYAVAHQVERFTQGGVLLERDVVTTNDGVTHYGEGREPTLDPIVAKREPTPAENDAAAAAFWTRVRENERKAL